MAFRKTKFKCTNPHKTKKQQKLLKHMSVMKQLMFEINFYVQLKANFVFSIDQSKINMGKQWKL